MKKKTYENPLMPNLRMKAMYRALVETQAFAKKTLGRHLEACFVAPAIGLEAQDLLSCAAPLPLLEHIRSSGARETARGSSKREIADLVRQMKGADSGGDVSGLERLLCAAGMAMALQRAAPGAVVMAWAAADELAPAAWRRVLEVALPGSLPLVLTVLPGHTDVAAIARRLQVNTLPVIPVDAGDSVALYRVAQESLVRARADGGLALIQAIDCGTDPVAMLGRQLIAKGIVTARWIEGVRES